MSELVDRIRDRYRLPKAIEDELHKFGASTTQLAMEWSLPAREVEWLRHEAVFHPDDSPLYGPA